MPRSVVRERAAINSASRSPSNISGTAHAKAERAPDQRKPLLGQPGRRPGDSASAGVGLRDHYLAGASSCSSARRCKSAVEYTTS
jgi:hypothetical protein